MDTWWQTETGTIVISPLPGITPPSPVGTRPFPGIIAEVVDAGGRTGRPGAWRLPDTDKPWPRCCARSRAIRALRRAILVALSRRYFTGDGCKVDDEGYYWLLGRVDDVMNVAGHRISTYEVESALVDHTAVAEAAVIGKTHEVKGQAISAFVTLKEGIAAERRAQRRTEAARRAKDRRDRASRRHFFASELPKRAAPKSCAACSAISPRAASSATPPPWPIPPWSPRSKTQYQDEGWARSAELSRLLAKPRINGCGGT